MQKAKQESEVRKFEGISIAEIDIPNQHGRPIEDVVKTLVRYDTTWNRTICYLISSARPDGRVEAETPEIFNAIFSRYEINSMSNLAIKETMKDINNVKHWLYQRRIMVQSNGERYLAANISVFRENMACTSVDEHIYIFANQNATDYSVE